MLQARAGRCNTGQGTETPGIFCCCPLPALCSSGYGLPLNGRGDSGGEILTDPQVLALTQNLLWPQLAGWHLPSSSSLLLSISPSLPLHPFIPSSLALISRVSTNPSLHPQLRGTVQPAGDFNDDGDAQVLRKAMKGLGKWGP